MDTIFFVTSYDKSFAIGETALIVGVESGVGAGECILDGVSLCRYEGNAAVAAHCVCEPFREMLSRLSSVLLKTAAAASSHVGILARAICLILLRDSTGVFSTLVWLDRKCAASFVLP